MGYPSSRVRGVFSRLARRSGGAGVSRKTTWCKISGLGMYDHRWTVESIRPWVMACLEIFGVERCFFATNWPVDRLFSSAAYDVVVDAYAEIIADLSSSEQAALFFANATKVYGPRRVATMARRNLTGLGLRTVVLESIVRRTPRITRARGSGECHLQPPSSLRGEEFEALPMRMRMNQAISRAIADEMET